MAREIKVGGIRIDVGVGFENVRKGLDGASKLLLDFEKKINKSLGSLGGPKIGLGIAGALGAIGVAATKAGLDFDKATSKIIRETNAVGVQLDALKGSFLRVSSSVGDDTGRVAQAVTFLSSSLGLAGKDLEKLSKTVLDLSGVAGNDLQSILSSSSQLFRQWGVSAEEQVRTLDLLFAVSQETAVSFDTLSAGLVKFGVPLRTLGMDVQTSVQVLAQLERAGLESEKIFAGLTKAIGVMTKAGQDPVATFQNLIPAIKQADEETSRLLAKQFVGEKSAVAFSAAIRAGAFDVDALTKAIGNYSGRIDEVDKRSETLGDKLEDLWKSMSILASTIGEPLVDGMKKALDAINPALAAFALRTKIEFDAAGIYMTAFFRSLPELSGVAFDLMTGGAEVAFRRILAWIDQVSAAAASMVQVLSSAASVVFAPASLRRGDYLAGVEESVAKLRQGISDIGKDTPQIEAVLSKLGSAAAKLDEIQKSGLVTEGDRERVRALIGDYDAAAATIGLIGSGAEGSSGKLGNFNFELEGASKKAKEAAKALESLNDKIRGLETSRKLDAINEGLQEAIDSDNALTFDRYKAELREATYQAALDGYEDLIKKGGPEALAKAQEAAGMEADDAIRKADARRAQELENKLKQSYQRSTDFFRSIFQNAINGKAFDFEDTFERIGVGLAGKIAEGMVKNSAMFSSVFGQVGSMEDLGEAIGDAIFNKGKGSGSGIFQIFDSISNRTRLPGVQGPTMADGSFYESTTDALDDFASQVFSGANTVEAYSTALLVSIDSLKKIGKGSYNTADGIIETLFAGVGAYLGGPAGAQAGSVIGNFVGNFVGDLFGDVVTHPEARARLGFEEGINELIRKVGGIQIPGPTGFTTMDRIHVGDQNRFDVESNAGWGEALFGQFGDRTTTAFLGIGEALRSVLGVTEEIGGQIGAILLENTGGSIEALRDIVDATGLSFDKFVEIMIDSGKRGAVSWLEVVSQIRDGSTAFADGIEGVGQISTAMERLLATSGRGAQALRQVQNIAVEAKEIGVSSLDDLRGRLVAAGEFSGQEIAALFEGFSAANVTTIDQIANATDLQLANVVARIDAYFQDNGRNWAETAEQIKATAEQLEKVNGSNVEIRFNVRTSMDQATRELQESGLLGAAQVDLNLGEVQKAATGGILNGPAFVRPGLLAGEAGPEAILPLRNVGGKLGVLAAPSKGPGLGGMTINVDARGASAGVAEEIRATLESIEERVLERAISYMMEAAE